MLCGIANLHYPDDPDDLIVEGFAKAFPGIEELTPQQKKEHVRWQELAARMQSGLIDDARRATQDFWPELWDDEERALAVLRKMRDLLRRFWSEPDKRTRDWYIDRARQYYQSLMIQREKRERLEAAKNKPTKEEALDAVAAWLSERDKELDQPPARNLFEDALFKLQERANKRSLAPLKCRYEKCLHPYFLRSKERRAFCTSDCFRQHKIDKALKAWHKHKHEWRPKTK